MKASGVTLTVEVGDELGVSLVDSDGKNDCLEAMDRVNLKVDLLCLHLLLKK